MKVLLFDPFNGAAGDMIIGALCAAGADIAAVKAAMTSVVGEPDIKPVVKYGISALSVDTHAEVRHRTLDEVLKIVNNSDASDKAKEMASRVFSKIADAEEKVHGKCAHFHEVGADDAVADVIGACTAILSINPDAVFIKPVNTGDGCIICEHGRIPVPAPAVLEIMKASGLEMTIGTGGGTGGSGHETGELCTPTGAALLSTFNEIYGCGSIMAPHGRIISCGYGAGTKDLPHSANVLRAVVMETGDEPENYVDILETNVDDVTGEVLAYTMKRVMDAGARDISALPVLMKKGRHGYLIKVICTPADSDKFVRILSEELGTLGIRHIRAVHRSVLQRRFEEANLTVNGKEYLIHVKVGSIDEKPVTVKAEFEDAKTAAESCGIPIKQISAMAESEVLKRINERIYK